MIGTVRAQYVVQPAGHALDAADIFGKAPLHMPVVVELGDDSYTPSAVSALADLAVDGHHIVIRGGRAAELLRREVHTLIRMRADI